MNVFSNFDSFFDADPKRIYNVTYNETADAWFSPASDGRGGVESPTFLGAHAVTIVGYDNNAQAWLVKNSWGADWADGGLFRVAYGAAGLGAEATDETYALV